MFSDEKMLLDLRLNTLNSYVDKFIIAEAKYLHNGKPKKLNFNINDFSAKFMDDKIEMSDITFDNPPGFKSDYAATIEYYSCINYFAH